MILLAIKVVVNVFSVTLLIINVLGALSLPDTPLTEYGPPRQAGGPAASSSNTNNSVDTLLSTEYGPPKQVIASSLPPSSSTGNKSTGSNKSFPEHGSGLDPQSSLSEEYGPPLNFSIKVPDDIYGPPSKDFVPGEPFGIDEYASNYANEGSSNGIEGNSAGCWWCPINDNNTDNTSLKIDGTISNYANDASSPDRIDSNDNKTDSAGGRPCRSTNLEENKLLVMNFYQEVFGSKKFDLVDKYIAEDIINHNPMEEDGRDSLRKVLEGPLGQGPPMEIDFKRVSAENDLVWTHTRLPVPSLEVTFAVVDIFRIKCGLIVEHWDVLQDINVPTSNPHPFF